MTSTIEYLGDLRTKATHLSSGQEIITDAPLDNRGKGEAFSPTDLVATALGCCMMTIMGIKARDEGIDIRGTRCEATKIMAAEPRRISRVELAMHLPARPYTAVERGIVERAARGCPVGKSIHPDLEVSLKFAWVQSPETTAQKDDQ